MTMMTVGDLARDLKVKNEDLVRQLVTMGFEVDGPESEVDAEDPAELRAKLVEVLPKQEVIEKRIKPTVIRRRVKKKAAAKAPKKTEAAAKPAEEKAEEASSPPETPEPPPKKKGAAKSKTAAKKAAAKPKPPAAKIIEKAPEPEEQKPAAAAKKTAAKPKTQKKTEPEATPTGKEKVQPKTAKKRASKVSAKKVADQETPDQEASVKEAPAPEPTPPATAEAEALEPKTEPEPEKAGEEKPAKKRKKKEKRMQPAQIIGHVDLNKDKVPDKPKPERPRPATPRAAAPAKSGPGFPPPMADTPPTDEERRKRKKKDKKSRDRPEEFDGQSKVLVRRRKEVLLHKDLYGETQRGGRHRPKRRKTRQRKTEVTTPKASKRKIKLPELITVSSLAHKMSVKASGVIQQLLGLGVTASINEGIDYDTAAVVASEFGFESEPAAPSEVDLLPTQKSDSDETLVSRPPVITVMGHVDHGKTSLLDAIRSTHVTDQEAGGITQHMGAYKVAHDKGEIVFLDTPGHEAFTAMRARGAEVTDFVVLVVAADDGVMDQTREAINHARAAHVPIVVAVNKIDKPEADRDRAIRELSEYELIPESWGGETLFTFVSAKTLEGIDEFLDTILLQAELMELKANPDKPAVGAVVEAKLDKGRGPVATVLVQQGTLRTGDAFVAGTNFGKVRAMLDHEGRTVTEVGPSTPVEVLGFAGVPEAGDRFLAVSDERVARQVGTQRQIKQREKEAEGAAGAVSLEDLMARMSDGEVKDLNIIVKADVQGSVEALQESLMNITSDEIKVKIIHSGVGTITESDVMLASASDAIIIGFNVRPTPKTSQFAEDKKIDLRLYTVIYEAIEDIRLAMEGLLTPIEKEVVVGQAEVRQTFSISRIGTIAGCYVKSGKLERSNSVRLIRDGVQMYEGKMLSMKRFKDDVKEAVEGFECGIVLENYKDVKVGDIIEAFTIEQESAKLS